MPEELERQVARAHYVNSAGQTLPLVASAYTVFEAKRAPTPAVPSARWPWLLLLGGGFGLLSWLTAQWMLRAKGSFPRRFFGAQHALFGLLLGLPGLLGFLMWVLTEHVVTYHNENQWLANPLTFCLLPLGVAIAFGSPRALRGARYICYVLAAMTCALYVLKLLPSFDQVTTLPMALITPVNLLYALAHHALQLHGEGRTAKAAGATPVLGTVAREEPHA